MKKFGFALCLVSCSSGAPPQKKVEPQPASVEVKPVTPQAALVVLPKSAPAPSTMETPATQPQALTMPGSIFLLDDIDSHPDPAMVRKFNAKMREVKTDEGCEPILVTTALLSIACLEDGGYIEPETARAPGGAYSDAFAYNFLLQDGVLTSIPGESIFSDLTAAIKLAEQGEYFRTLSFGPPISIESDEFILTKDGVFFFVDNHQSNIPDTQISFDKNPEIFHLDQPPLSLLKKMQPLPAVEDVQAYANLIERLPFDEKIIPSSMVVYGTVVAGAHWMDFAGENYLFITERESKSKKDPSHLSRYVNAYHYRVTLPASMPASAPTSAPTSEPASAPVVTNVRSVFTKEENCAATNRAGFVKDSILVTDYDLDGVGEVSFAATLGCGETINSTSLSVYLLEAGGKFSLTGQDSGLVQSGPFQNVSESFFQFLKLRWTQLEEALVAPASAPTTPD